MPVNFNNRVTPFNSDYSSCDECQASLLVYTGNESPEIVTRLLNIEPTKMQVAGEDAVLPSGIIKKARVSYWFLESENAVSSEDIRNHLDWLLARLNKSKTGLRELQSIHGVEMYVHCRWESATGGGGPVLWPEQMKCLADLNLECSFYFCDFN